MLSQKLSYIISKLISLSDYKAKYYQGIENGSVLKDPVRSLKNGLQFIGKLYMLLGNDVIEYYDVMFLVDEVEDELIMFESDGVLDIVKLDRVCKDRLVIMRSFTFDHIFEEDIHSHKYGGILDHLLEYIPQVPSDAKLRGIPDDKTAALVKKLGKLKRGLIYNKPFYFCLARHPDLVSGGIFMLPNLLNKAAAAVYLLLIGEMDEINVVWSLKSAMSANKQCLKKINIYARFLKFSRYSQVSSDLGEQFYILNNLIHLLETNSDSLNDANGRLFVKLKKLRKFVANQSGNERLNHYLGLTASTESICYQAQPIIQSCYMEEHELEEDIRLKLNDIIISVFGQIKIIKRRHSSQEIKLYDYPRFDGLGFLEYIMGYLKLLQGHEQTSVIRSEIDALHTDIHCLMSLPGTAQEKQTSESLWSHIVQLAYQAEYVIDLYLVIHDGRCISTLSNTVVEVRETKEKLLALLDKSLHVEDADVITSSHVHGTPLQVNNVFIGFQEVVDVMMKFLSGGENDLKTIAVVGMAGAGKTSLAMHLFKKSSVVGQFDKKAWCTVSQRYLLKDLLLTILNQIDPFESDFINKDDQDLADQLCRILKGHRYLSVIDDIWDVALWNCLSRCFPKGNTRSRILITTRDHNVALRTESTIHELRALTEDESWELLRKKLHQQESLPANLERIAKEASKSCKGLPLSIAIIGGLMHNVGRNEKMWSKIAKETTSTILSDPQGKCENILELSYNHLPNQLKSCLLYLGVFREDQEISVSRLIKLWVAEGLLRGGITLEESAEDTGKRYVDDLISRSLIIPIKEKTLGGVKIFQLHDLLRDFCLKKANETHFFTVLDDRGIYDLSLCPRRISINSGMDKHLPFIYLNSVRTILSFWESNFVNGELERIIDSEHMILLNVLDIQSLKYPFEYGHHLVHLRYLAIRHLECMDEGLSVLSSISKLWNLQILILTFNFVHAVEVPDSIWDLVKLRHIHLLPSASLPRHDRRFQDSSTFPENLKSLLKTRLHYGDSSWVCKFQRLEKLSCIFFYSRDDTFFQQNRFLELESCNRLTSLSVKNGVKENEQGRCKLHFPRSLKEIVSVKIHTRLG